MRDPLTHLPNRRAFEHDVNTALKRSNGRITVLLLGIAEFRKLNDVYGHLGCDAALSQVAARLRGKIDAASVFARIGDEFAVFLAHSDPEMAGQIPCSLVESVEEACPNRDFSSSTSMPTWA